MKRTTKSIIKNRIAAKFQPNDIYQWRSWLVNTMLLIGIVGFPLSFIFTFPVFISEGLYWLIVIDSVVYGAILIHYFAEGLSYWGRGLLSMAVVYMMAISFHVALGPHYARPVWLVLGAVMAALLFGVRAAVSAVVFNMMILMGLYWAMGPERIGWEDVYRAPFAQWIMFVVNSAIITLACALPVGFLLNKLDISMRRQRIAAEGLLGEAEKLRAAHEALQRETVGREGAELKLRDSERKFRNLVENLNEGIYSLDEEGVFRYINPAVKRILGYGESEIVGRRFSDFVPAEVMDSQKDLTQGTAFPPIGSREFRILHEDGTTRWVRNSTRTVSEGNAIVGREGVIFDITERKQAEGAIQGANEKYAILFENAGDGIFIVQDDRIRFPNPRALELTEYSREELREKTLSEILRPMERETDFTEQETESAAGIGPPTFTHRLIGKSGREIWVERSSINITWDGRPASLNFIRDITLRKAAEERLKVSERLFRDIFDASFDGIFIHDAGKIIDMNVKASLELGFTKEELLDEPIVNLVAREDLEATLERLRMVTERPELEYGGAEARLLRKDGTKVHVEYFSRSTFYEGRDARIIAFRDISDRKRTENALRQSESRYRSLFESAHDAIFILKGDRFVDCNPKTLDVFGVSLQEIIGRSPYDFSPPRQPDGKPSKEAALERIRAAYAGEPQFFEWKHTKRDGVAFDAEVTLHMIDQAEGVVLQCMLRDISERKKAEQALRESEERYRNIFERAAVGIVNVNLQGRLTFVNQKFCDMLGYTAEELLALDLRHVTHSEDLPESHRRVADLLSGKSRDAFQQKRYVRKDGSIVWANTSGSMLTDESGKPKFLVGIIEDITDQKQLESRVRQSQKMEAIGTLAGGIAHDFNNILTSVLGFTELAKMKLGMGKNLDNELDEVMNAGFRARDLVKQILAFSRRTDIEKGPIAIRSLIKESVKFLKSSLPSTIEIRYDMGGSDATVMADPTQLHQILMNLCTNAAHAMKDEGGVLDLRLEEVEIGGLESLQHKKLKSGKYFRLTVSDTGHGIREEFIEKVFDPFFTTKPRGEGTGLGLSVVHGIVTDMGGAVSVESTPGQGAVFTVLLPFNEAAALEQVSAHPAPPKGKGGVLLVDDEKAILESGRGVLEHLGYEVTTANGSLEALDIFRAKPDAFDLVLTDMTMPKMTGLELAKQLLSTRPDIPIVLCTGFSEGLTPDSIRDIGIRDMIMKPMIGDELAVTLARALKDRE